MPAPSFLLLYVDEPARSAAFYADLLGQAPVEASATFALFVLGALKLGLWSRHTVEPGAAAAGGGGELGFPVGGADEVDRLHADWADRGLTILQPPSELDFGRTFVAADPDGHRLRVFWPRPDES